MSRWINSDGLLVKTGTSEAAVSKAGVFEDGYGNEHIIEAYVNYSDFEAYGTDTLLSDSVIIPDGARIVGAEIYVETAFAGTNATLEVGLLKKDYSTAYDADGLVAATATASLTAAATITGAGALVGTTLAYDGLLTATVRTANFTAGRARIRVRYYQATAGTHS